MVAGWWPSQRQRTRLRIASWRRTGSVLQWSGRYGWITPDDAIEHPEAWKHNCRVYVNLKDVDSGEPLSEGARVSFLAYSDGDGIGAEEVRLEDGADPAENHGAVEEDGPVLVKRPGLLLNGNGKGHSGGLLGVQRTIEKSNGNGAAGKGACKGKGKGKSNKENGNKGVCLSPGPGGGADRNKTSYTDQAAVLCWASSEMRGWRPAMEDASVAILGLPPPLERHAMFGVFDGHGGASVSRIASADLPAEIVKAAASDLATGGPLAAQRARAPPAERGEEEDGGFAGRALSAALPSLDSAIREAGADQPGFLPGQGGSGPIPSDVRNAYALTGSTSVVALLECDGAPQVGRPHRVVVANCGDSRALLCRAGECIELSQDHKPDDDIERERIEKAGGFVAACGPCQRIDGWGLNLSRALGDFHYKAREDLPPEDQKVSVIPDIRSSDITDEDEFLLLCCDGVFELHSSQEAVDHVRQQLVAGLPLQEAVESLVDASCSQDLVSTQGKGSDNVSAMIVLLR